MKKVLYFGAEFCPQCRALRPTVEHECGDAFVYIDAEEDTDIVRHFGVKNIPTMIVVEGEREIGRGVGIEGWTKVQSLLLD